MLERRVREVRRPHHAWTHLLLLIPVLVTAPLQAAGRSPFEPPAGNGALRDHEGHSAAQPDSGRPDGVWRDVLPPPPRSHHAAALDRRRGRILLIGGSGGLFVNGPMPVAVLSVEDRSWSELVTTGESPGPRRGHSVVYDEVGDRVILFGGWNLRTFLSECWVLSLDGVPRWSRLETIGSPPPRSAHAAVFDSAARRMLVIGGADAMRRMNDVWALDLGGTPTWSQMTVAGLPPTARHSHSATFDPLNRQVLVFGGHDGALANDLWSLALGSTPAWSFVPTGVEVPAPRKDHVGLFDDIGRRMIVIGGEQSSGVFDSWDLPVDQEPRWRRIADGDSLHPARRSAAAVLARELNSVVLHGGWNVNARREHWTLQLEPAARWTIQPPAQLPPDGSEITALYDSPRQRPIVVFAPVGGAPRVYEPWTVPPDLKSWAPLPVIGEPPIPRFGSSVILDPLHDRLISTMGHYHADYEWRTTNRVWTLALDRPSGWVEATPEGDPPLTRAHAASVYDPVGQRLLLFGGWRHEAPLYVDEYFNEIWALSLGDTLRWELLTPEGVRPPRMAAAEAVYDPISRRMLVYGGAAPVNQYGLQLLEVVWALSLGDTLHWEELVIEGPRPRGRWGHRLAWESARDRVILHGGRYDYGSPRLPEVWALEFGDSTRWRELSIVGPPISLDWPGVTYDPIHDRMLVFGTGNTVRAMEFTREEPPPAPQPGPDLLTLIGPNPAHGSVDCLLALSRPGETFLDAFDVGGRRIRRIIGRTFAAGIHPLTWDARDDRGQALPAGLYFVHARTSSTSQTRRVVILR